jgi:hypothetical protein
VRRSSTVLALWTLFVWVTRIENAVNGDEGAGPIVLSCTFLALAALVLATRGHNGFWAITLAGWTVLVWLVRAVDIAFLSDHGAGFVVVHLALAVISWVLAAWVERDLGGRRERAAVSQAAEEGHSAGLPRSTGS